MKDKQTVLLIVSYLTEMTPEEINTDYGLLDKLTNEIGNEDINISVDDKQVILRHQGVSALILDEGRFNCGRCAKCGGWTTDKEKPDAIEGLSRGTVIDGKLICDQCKWDC